MKKSGFVILGLLFCIAAPAVAQSVMDSSPSSTASDQKAIAKDDVALAKDNKNLATNRAKKAYHKKVGDTTGQAVDSAKIGANQTAIGEKETEKAADQKVLDEDSK